MDAPDDAFPPYAFVSPEWPHPRNHERGHSYGAPEPHAAPLDPAAWERSPAYLRSIALFDAGYYWEAHEGWEALWNAAGREGVVADFLRGLIKLAAAGVKARQGRQDGVRIHGERALACFASVRASAASSRFAGLSLDDLEAFARDLAEHPERFGGDPRLPVEVIFARRLAPSLGRE